MTRMETPEEFAQRFSRAVMPSEENSFRSCLRKDYWSVDQFASLLAGLDPETYKRGKAQELPEKEYKKRAAGATHYFHLLLEDIEKKNWRRAHLIPVGDAICASSWRWIKWLAQQPIIPNPLFFEYLPLHLKELYFEFQPTESALRTALRHSRVYHEAFYLDHARRLLDWEVGDSTPSQIYKHPHMQNVERYIREMGGSYTRRTIVESWLRKLKTRSRGRPKKS